MTWEQEHNAYKGDYETEVPVTPEELSIAVMGVVPTDDMVATCRTINMKARLMYPHLPPPFRFQEVGDEVLIVLEHSFAVAARLCEE